MSHTQAQTYTHSLSSFSAFRLMPCPRSPSNSKRQWKTAAAHVLLEAPLSEKSVLPSTLQSAYHASAAAATLVCGSRNAQQCAPSAWHICRQYRSIHVEFSFIQTCIGGLECSACMYSACGISVHIATSYMIIVYYLRDIDDDRDCGR